MHSPSSVVRFLFVLLTFTSLTLCLVVGESGPSDVLTLTPDTFDEFVGRDIGTIVKFYAPWCGHCKALAPEYAAVASAFKSHSSTVRVASVDCDQFDVVCARFNIRGYPTLLWFPANASGRYEEYASSNSATAIVAFLNANTGLTVATPKSPSALPKAAGKPGAVSSVLTLTPENVKEHIGGPVPILVEFFAPWCAHCKNLAPHYELAAQAYRDAGVAGDRIKVAALDADAYPSIGHEFGVKGFPTLKYFPANSNVAIDYTGGRTAQAIVDYLNDKIEMKVAVPESADFDSGAAAAAQAKVAFAYPSVVHLTKENIDDIIGGSVPVLVEFYAPWCQHCKSFAPEYEEAASMFVNVAGAKIAALDGDAFPTLATRFNVKGFPTILYFPAGSKEGKEYDGPRTSAGLVKYVNAQAGTQAQVPGLPQLDGPSAVIQLNNDNFDTIVEDESKNVIVYFYAPWCPHCKRLSPEYEKAALELVGDAGGESNLVIAAIDCDEYPKLAEHIEGFPTIMFYGQIFEDTAATDVVVKKVPTEIELSPSTTKDQLVKFIRDHVAGSVAPSNTGAPASTDDSGKVTSGSSTATATGSGSGSGSGTGAKVAPQAGQTITLSNDVADGTFFNCDVSSSAEGGKFPEGIELRIDAKYAEVQGFPATFSIDAEQFATYNWQAKPLSTIGQEATVTVQFVGSVPETVSFKCFQGKQSTKPDVATVSN